MASLTQGTWVWAYSGRWWKTWGPGVLQSMRTQRVRHNWVNNKIYSHAIFNYSFVWVLFDNKRSKQQNNKTNQWNKFSFSERWTPQIGAQYATGDQWRNNSRKNEEMEPKQKQYPAVNMTGDESRSDAVKSNIAWEPGVLGPWIKANWKWSNRRWQEWTSAILGISKLKWTGKGEFNSDDH